MDTPPGSIQLQNYQKEMILCFFVFFFLLVHSLTACYGRWLDHTRKKALLILNEMSTRKWAPKKMALRPAQKRWSALHSSKLWSTCYQNRKVASDFLPDFICNLRPLCAYWYSRQPTFQTSCTSRFMTFARDSWPTLIPTAPSASATQDRWELSAPFQVSPTIQVDFVITQCHFSQTAIPPTHQTKMHVR